MNCREVDVLLQQISELTEELRGWADELKMTPKRDPRYAEKSQGLKRVRGRLGECHEQLRQHFKEHGCNKA
jgi:hypothetical protein